MTEKESREFEEKVAEHQREVAEKGYAERGNERYYEIETPYGKVAYIVTLARQERIFRNLAIIHMMISSGIKVDPARLGDLAVYPPFEKDLDEWVDENCAPKDTKFIDETTAKAIKFYGDNLRDMFSANMENYVQEAFFYGLIKTVGKENPKPPASESVIFNGFAEFNKLLLRKRLDIRKSSGRKSKRTDEELQEMLSFYDATLRLVQAAKKDYTPRKKKRGWVKLIKEMHPHLPVEIIERFDQLGVTPAELTLVMTADKFNAEPNEALRKKIMQTRKTNAGK